MKNLYIRYLLVSTMILTPLTTIAQSDTVRGIEVNIMEQNNPTSIEDRVREIDATISLCEEFNSKVNVASRLMNISLNTNRKVIASCEARNINAIVGKDAKDAYLEVCFNRLERLKSQSKKYAAIADSMVKLLPVAKQMIKDGLLSKEQLEIALEAERNQKIMMDAINDIDTLKDQLEDSL